MSSLIRSELGALTTGEDAEAATEHFLRLQAIKSAVREAVADAEQMLVEWFEDHPGTALEVGDFKVFLGEKKSAPKPRNLIRLLDAILTHTEGDLDRFAEFLSSSPVKYGEVKAQMGEDAYEEHFEQRVAPAVKEGKRLPKGLVVVNTKFLNR